MSISLCMIVKDGVGDGVEVAIGSARPYVDEVCVFDTGSTDGTLELLDALASQPGAPLRVERGEWRDDFAWARNESAAMASSDWLLWLDANDELVGGEHMRGVVERADTARADIAWVLWDRYGRAGRFGLWPSLVRAGTGEWEGIVHECWRRPGIDRWRHGVGQFGSVYVHPAKLRVFHRDRAETPFKYLHLLTQAAQDPARTPWALVALADEIASIDPRHALELYERHLAEGWDNGEGALNHYRYLTLQRLSELHAANGNTAEAGRYATAAATFQRQEFAALGEACCVFLFNELTHEPKIRAWMAMNPRKVDDVLLAAPPPSFPNVGRNDPCPCGNGKRFKKCHGA